MNEEITLRELLRMITPTGLSRVPGKVMLKENATRIASHESDEFLLSVFSCGYALAESGKRWTVFNVSGCGGYEYEANEDDRQLLRGEDYRFEDAFFLDLPWPVRLSMEALDRLESNNDANENALLSEHPDEPGPGGRLHNRYVSVEDEVIAKIEYEEVMSKLTPKQRQAYVLYFDEGYTQQEIGAMFTVSHEAISKRIRSLITKLQKELLMMSICNK